MAEEIYNLKFSGEETDEILESAKNVKDANLTTLNDISGFVCIDKNGNAIGMMSKEQVASVVGGLLQGSLLPSFRSQELTHGDMNSFTKPMMCRLNTYGDSQWTKTNWPTVATQGVFSVTVCGDLIVQEVFGLEAKYGYACRIYADGTWKKWMETAK